MDELVMIDHFIAVGREISEIRAANRAYWSRKAHNRLERELHERRRQRLEEIRKDFPLWFNAPLPETGINFAEPRGERTSGMTS
jgi:hypothetical protein